MHVLSWDDRNVVTFLRLLQFQESVLQSATMRTWQTRWEHVSNAVCNSRTCSRPGPACTNPRQNVSCGDQVRRKRRALGTHADRAQSHIGACARNTLRVCAPGHSVATRDCFQSLPAFPQPSNHCHAVTGGCGVSCSGPNVTTSLHVCCGRSQDAVCCAMVEQASKGPTQSGTHACLAMDFRVMDLCMNAACALMSVADRPCASRHASSDVWRTHPWRPAASTVCIHPTHDGCQLSWTRSTRPTDPAILWWVPFKCIVHANHQSTSCLQ